MEYVDGSMVPVCFTKADTFWPMFYFLVINTMFYLGPFILLIFMYSVIAQHLMADPGTNCSESAYNIRARKQVVAMLITVVVAFFLCLLPFRMFTLWIILAPIDYLLNVKMNNYYHILFSCRIMLYLNSAINPILYNLMSSKFRQGFKNLIESWIFCKKRHKSRFRLRYSNTLSTTLTHSSTKVTILARTGSSLLLRRGRTELQERCHKNGFLRGRTESVEEENAVGDVNESNINLRRKERTDDFPPKQETLFQLIDQPESFV